MLSWDNRLVIATEIAGALAYLHSYATVAISHRDIKSINIFLAENYRVVVSDFGISRSVPMDKTHLTTIVGGTIGYLDPEYFNSGQLNDKSDVYSFGVVLAELVIGQKPVPSSKSDVGLVIKFRTSVKENQLIDIVEKTVTDQGREEEILAVANLAKRCLKINARKRPSMKEIVAELEQLQRTRKRSIGSESFPDGYCSVSERSYNCNIDFGMENDQEVAIFQLQHVITDCLVESDSSLLCAMVDGKSSVAWRIAGVVRKIRILAPIASSFHHIFREANGVADALANMGFADRCFRIFSNSSDLPVSVRQALRLNSLQLGSFRFARNRSGYSNENC